MSYDYSYDKIVSQDNPGIRMLDNAGQMSLVKIYCACGRIVDLDVNAMSVKKSLSKDLECPSCRNARISKDIDLLNALFDAECAPEDCAFY